MRIKSVADGEPYVAAPPTTDLASLVRMVKMRWWIEQGYQQLKDELGLDHFEGRRWQGWRHHVTLTMIAFAFLFSLDRLAPSRAEDQVLAWR